MESRDLGNKHMLVFSSDLMRIACSWKSGKVCHQISEHASFKFGWETVAMTNLIWESRKIWKSLSPNFRARFFRIWLGEVAMTGLVWDWNSLFVRVRGSVSFWYMLLMIGNDGKRWISLCFPHTADYVGTGKARVNNTKSVLSIFSKLCWQIFGGTCSGDDLCREWVYNWWLIRVLPLLMDWSMIKVEKRLTLFEWKTCTQL